MLAPRFKGRYLLLNASHGLASHSTSAPRRLLASVTGDERNRALRGLFANCVTSGERQPQEPQITYGEDSPKWNKFPNSHYLTSLRERRPPLTGYRERAAVSASRRVPERFPANRGTGCTANARKPGREGGEAPEGAEFRGGPRARSGLRNLAVTGRFFLLFSSFLARSRTLSPLPRSHPSLFPQLRLRVGSDVTSAEIPPNSTAQWRAGGRAGSRAGSAAGDQGASAALGRARGEPAGATGNGAGERGGGRRAAESGAGEGAGRAKQEREPGRALRQEPSEPQAQALPLWKGAQEGRMGRRRRKRNLRQTGSSNKSEGERKGVGETETYSWGVGWQTQTGREEGMEKVAQEMEQRTVYMGLSGGKACGV